MMPIGPKPRMMPNQKVMERRQARQAAREARQEARRNPQQEPPLAGGLASMDPARLKQYLASAQQGASGLSRGSLGAEGFPTPQNLPSIGQASPNTTRPMGRPAPEQMAGTPPPPASMGTGPGTPPPPTPMGPGGGMKRGGKVGASKMKPVKTSVSKMSSASKRGDGIAQRGKTRGRMV